APNSLRRHGLRRSGHLRAPRRVPRARRIPRVAAVRGSAARAAAARARHFSRVAARARGRHATLGTRRLAAAHAAQSLARAALCARRPARGAGRPLSHAATLGRGARAMSAQLESLQFTAAGEPRGYIEPHALREVWFHTGTACNLACPFCLEGSKPGDSRLGRITLAEAAPFIDEAVALGVEQLSFTGGEPFIVKDFVNILRYASQRKPCLVLTNGTAPLLKRLTQIAPLREQPHPIAFRVSIDYPDRARHDAGRGAGTFDQSWSAVAKLHALGFRVSIARQMQKGENAAAVAEAYAGLLAEHGLPRNT